MCLSSPRDQLHMNAGQAGRKNILLIRTLRIPEDHVNAALAHVFQRSNELQTAVKAGTQFIYGNIIFISVCGGWADVKQWFSNFFNFKDPNLVYITLPHRQWSSRCTVYKVKVVQLIFMLY